MTETADTCRVVVVDDEARARRLVKARLAELNGFKLVGEAATGAEAIDLISESRPDLVVLDIQMPRGSGVEVIETIGVEKMPPTIFVTAYDEYAVKAFELHAVDYLLKPFTRERFDEALERGRKMIKGGAAAPSHRQLKKFLDYFSKAEFPDEDNVDDQQYLKRITVTTVEPWRTIEVNNIDWFEAQDHFVRIHSDGKSCLVAGKLSDFEKQLDPVRFFRIHRSTIVNLGSVKSVQSATFGALELKLPAGEKLRVSRSRRDETRVAFIRWQRARPDDAAGA